MSKRRDKVSAVKRGESPKGLPRTRDSLTRITRYCEFLALGLVAVALILKFPNDLQRGNGPAVSMDNFTEMPQKLAVLVVHTRIAWVVLTIFGTIVAVLAYRARYALRKNRLAMFAPLVVFLVVGIHAGAQAYLQSQGTLKIEVRSAGPVGVLNSAVTTREGGPLLSSNTETITRMTVSEGTAEEWKLLLLGDFLFAAPIFFVWLLRFWPEKFKTGAGGEEAAVKV